MRIGRGAGMTRGRGVGMRRPPPDYRMRGTQLRLFVLVAALMTVLVGMNEVRKPQTWAWLWTGGQVRPNPSADENIETLLPESGVESSEASPAKNNAAELTTLDVTDAAGSTQAFRLAAWMEVYRQLERDQRQRLAHLLLLSRQPDRREEAEGVNWQSLLNGLNEAWSKLFESQRRLVAEVDPAEPELSQQKNQRREQLVASLQESWNERDRPALKRLADDDALTVEDQLTLREIQEFLDQSDLEAIRDDTVFRPDEREAWFRMFEQLQAADPSSLAERSVGTVQFLQIFRQPKEYRGQLVTLRGTVRLAYRVVAPPNPLGIKEYCLLWVRPADGTNVPIVVYALKAPDGFPALSREEQTSLREEVEVTGYFFKRWVYRAQDGLNSVPLVLAGTPLRISKPPPPVDATVELRDTLGKWTWPVVAAGVAALAMLAGGLAWLASWSSRARISAELDETPTDWDKLPSGPSVDESLRRLAEQDQEANTGDGE